MNNTNKWIIRAALHEEIDNGHIWATTNKQFAKRQIVCLKNTKNKKITFCETLSIDENFCQKYNASDRTKNININEHFLVINEWYRDKLGINPNAEESIEIKNALPCIGKIRACLHHPQIVVRVATWLGIISVSLGVISILLALLSR